jgi:rhodanese-related sulfurtransferase
MSAKPITPAEARRLVDEGAVLVDIREAAEHARENIPGDRLHPLSSLDRGEAPALGDARAVVFYCRSGMRTRTNAQRLAEAGAWDAYVLEGGLEAWRKAGLPVTVDRKQPLPIMRQVQIAAGGLVVVGVALGYLASPWFFLLSGFVGAGLMRAGITGWCGMAMLLERMPWNRRAPA